MTIDEAIRRIQFAYPQVYFACHTRHQRRKSSRHAVSASDVQVLVHLDTDTPTSLTGLARHMGLARSTLSETVSRLGALGYVAKSPAVAGDRRRVMLELSAKGLAAVRANSVLEPRRLRVVLERLPDAKRRAAVRGLGLLAAACRPVQVSREGVRG